MVILFNKTSSYLFTFLLCAFITPLLASVEITKEHPEKIIKLTKFDSFFPGDYLKSGILPSDKKKLKQIKNIPIGAWPDLRALFKSNNINFEDLDSAWYQLSIHVPENFNLTHDYALMVPMIVGPSEYFLNRERLSESAQKKHFQEKNSSFLGRKSIIILSKNILKSGENTFSIRTRKSLGLIGGFRSEIMLFGPTRTIFTRFSLETIRDSGLALICIFISIYFLIYYYRNKDKYYLYFSIMGLSLGFWIFGYKGYAMFFHPHGVTDILFTYLGGLLPSPMLLNFIHSFFKRTKRIFAKSLEVIFYTLIVLLVLELIFTKSIHFFNTYLYDFFMLSVLINITYCLVINMLEFKNRKPMAGRILLGQLFLFSSICIMLFAMLPFVHINEFYFGETYFAMTVIFATVLSSRLSQMHKSLEVAHEGLKDLDKMKDNFLASTSHELRTPLQGIIGLSEVLLSSNKNPLLKEQKSMMEKIQQSGMRLTSLIDDLLDAAQIKQKNLVIRTEPTSLIVVAKKAVASQKALALKKNIAINCDISNDLPYVMADKERLEQIFNNLINNAIKFTEEGSINITAVNEDNYIAVHVQDTGIGIPPERSNEIFKEFSQVSAGDTRDYEGTGIGLSIVQHLVELHRGRIWVESENHTGTTFIFTLTPATKKGKESHQGIYSEYKKQKSKVNENNINLHSNKKTQKKVKKHILIVDDDKTNTDILSHQIKDMGYLVTTCTNGEQAYQLFTEKKVSVDMALVDIMMPGMSGFELTQLLRKQYTKQDLPILMLTAKVRREDMETGFQAGANDYITKPFLFSELAQRVDNQFMLQEANQQKKRLEQIDHDLELTNLIRKNIFPKKSPSIEGIDIFTHHQSVQPVGGDYYDFFAIDKHKFGILFCDITGEGITATVITAMLKIAFDQQEVLADSPIHLIAQLNYLMKDYLESFSVTASYSFIDTENKTMFYTNAGHPPLLIYRAKENRCIQYKQDTKQLGMNTEADFKSREILLHSEDRIILYSDGFINAVNSGDESYGLERLNESISKTKKYKPKKASQEIIKSVQKWSSGQSWPQDDITLAIMDVH